MLGKAEFSLRLSQFVSYGLPAIKIVRIPINVYSHELFVMQCDVLAQGVVEAAKDVKLKVPLVVRLAGTNFKEGKKILDASGLEILSADNLNDAAKKIVKLV